MQPAAFITAGKSALLSLAWYASCWENWFCTSSNQSQEKSGFNSHKNSHWH